MRRYAPRRPCLPSPLKTRIPTPPAPYVLLWPVLLFYHPMHVSEPRLLVRSLAASIAQGYLEARGMLPPGHPMGSSMLSGMSGGTGGMSEASYDPPRIHGVDTASRPPLVVHSDKRVYRPAWIGVSY